MPTPEREGLLIIGVAVVAPASFVIHRLVLEAAAGAEKVQAQVASETWRQSLADQSGLASIVHPKTGG